MEKGKNFSNLEERNSLDSNILTIVPKDTEEKAKTSLSAEYYEIIEFFIEKEGISLEDVKGAIRKIEKLKNCGKKVMILVNWQPNKFRSEGKILLRVIPIRCYSIFCKQCSKKRFSGLEKYFTSIEKFFKKGKPVVFITLTWGAVNFNKIRENLDEIKKIFRRLIHKRINIKKLIKIYKDARDTCKLDEVQKKKQDEIFKEFIKTCKKYEGEKFLKILKFIYKFELVPNGDKVDIHVHIVLVGLKIPQIFLSAMWMSLTRGFSKIVDIRRVKDIKGLSNYFKKFSKKKEVKNMENLNLNNKIILESSLYNRKLWGAINMKPERKKSKIKKDLRWEGRNFYIKNELSKKIKHLPKDTYVLNSFVMELAKGEGCETIAKYRNKKFKIKIDKGIIKEFEGDEKYFLENLCEHLLYKYFRK